MIDSLTIKPTVL